MIETGHFEKFESYVPVDLLSVRGFLLAILVLNAFIIARYFLMVFPFYFFYWLKPKGDAKVFLHRKLKPGQIGYEIRHSLFSCVIFAFAGYWMGLEWQFGLTDIYLKFAEFHWYYLPISFLLLSLSHEIYFYATHRWMHLPRVFRNLHSVHHFSSQTSPWASFSFSAGEALIQAAFLPLIVLILPLHPVVLICYLTFMTLTAISNHLGVELIGSSWVQAWFISGTHHSIHHEKFNRNFGLYFRFLDQWFGTEVEAKGRRNTKTNLVREVL